VAFFYSAPPWSTPPPSAAAPSPSPPPPPSPSSSLSLSGSPGGGGEAASSSSWLARLSSFSSRLSRFSDTAQPYSVVTAHTHPHARKTHARVSREQHNSNRATDPSRRKRERKGGVSSRQFLIKKDGDVPPRQAPDKHQEDWKRRKPKRGQQSRPDQSARAPISRIFLQPAGAAAAPSPPPPPPPPRSAASASAARILRKAESNSASVQSRRSCRGVIAEPSPLPGGAADDAAAAAAAAAPSFCRSGSFFFSFTFAAAACCCFPLGVRGSGSGSGSGSSSSKGFGLTSRLTPVCVYTTHTPHETHTTPHHTTPHHTKRSTPSIGFELSALS
jgi:hypothetical protein